MELYDNLKDSAITTSKGFLTLSGLTCGDENKQSCLPTFDR